MNYSKQYITELIEKFNEGQTTEAEEQMLAEYFASSAEIPSEWDVYKEMFQSFGSGAYEFTEAEISAYLTTQETMKKPRTMWAWLSAACVAGIVGMVWFQLSTAEVEQELTVAELYETMSLLSEAGYDQVGDLTATPSGNGFVIKAALADGRTCSFTMERSGEGISIKSL